MESIAAPRGQSTAVAITPPPAPLAVTETASSAVAAREKAAVEARFLVAINRPRNPDESRIRLLARCASPHFAAVAEYSKPVGGKKVRGASIRMMEEVARQWRNVDVQAPVVFDDSERRIIRVTATDLESNYSASVDVILEKTVERKAPRQGDEVLSRRTNSQNEIVYRIRADEDAFLVKQNANISKARRECIRAIVPGDLLEEAMQACGETRRSEVKTDPAGARKRIADAFFSLGVMPAQLCELLGKPSLEAVTEAEIELLRSIYAAMNDGEATWQDVVEAHGAKKQPASEAKTSGKGVEALKASGFGGKSGGKTAPASAQPSLTDAEILAEDRKLAAEEA